MEITLKRSAVEREGLDGFGWTPILLNNRPAFVRFKSATGDEMTFYMRTKEQHDRMDSFKPDFTPSIEISYNPAQ